MSIKKVSITTNSNMEDVLSSVLFDNGILATIIEDKKPLSTDELDEMYVDIPLELSDDGKATIIFYANVLSDDEYKTKLEENKKNNKYVDSSYFDTNDNIFTEESFHITFNNIKNKLNEMNEYLDLGDLNIKVEDIESEDYMKKWRDNFTEFYIDDILIRPYWSENKYNNGLVINIDPGMAFGTGKHETTKLCIQQLRKTIEEFDSNNKNISDIKMLDIGCGSGILGILCYKLGIRDILSIDVDKNIDDTIKNNLSVNNIDQNDFKVLYGNIIDDEDIRKKVGYNKYDIVVANILAPVIEALVDIGRVDKFMSDNSYFISSGILKEKKDEVLSYYNKNENLKILNIYEDGDWVCIVAKKLKN